VSPTTGRVLPRVRKDCVLITASFGAIESENADHLISTVVVATFWGFSLKRKPGDFSALVHFTLLSFVVDHARFLVYSAVFAELLSPEPKRRPVVTVRCLAALADKVRHPRLAVSSTKVNLLAREPEHLAFCT